MTRSEYQELADFFVARLSHVHEETRAFVQVSVESLRDEIRVVADGVLTNGRRIEENGRRIDENGVRIDVLSGRVDVLSGRVDVLSGRVDALTDRVGRLEGTVSAGFAAQDSRIRALES
jgi:hypothetical protein